tara:strand:+ start:906 stop:1550 length:645 start_codon:yes stop_codon:yes gene_type:complete
MPIYNGIEFINDSLSSIIDQTFEEWELIIGVNGHEKNSFTYQFAVECAKMDEKISVYDFYELKGKTDALNKMITFAKYDYIAILDVDDIWLPEKLEKQVPFLKDYDVVGTQCVYFENIENVSPQIPFGDLSNVDFTKVNPIINSSSITRKELCLWKGDGLEDYDLWIRLKNQNKKFYNIDEILVKHRIHNSSAFNSKDQNERLREVLNENRTSN